MAEWTDFDDDGSCELSLLFGSEHNGAIVIGDKFFRVTKGEAKLDLSLLANGEYAPRLESDKGIFYAEGFTKSGAGIVMNSSNEELIRRLVGRCYSLENALRSLESRLSAIEKEHQGHRIFNFERK